MVFFWLVGCYANTGKEMGTTDAHHQGRRSFFALYGILKKNPKLSQISLCRYMISYDYICRCNTYMCNVYVIVYIELMYRYIYLFLALKPQALHRWQNQPAEERSQSNEAWRWIEGQKRHQNPLCEAGAYGAATSGLLVNLKIPEGYWVCLVFFRSNLCLEFLQ